jgi:hypothetical protein
MLDYSPKFLYDEKKRPRQSFKFLHVVVVAIKKEPKCHERGNWIATFVCLCGIYVESLKEKKSSSFFSDFNTFLPFFYFLIDYSLRWLEATWRCKVNWRATFCISPEPKDSSGFASMTRKSLKEVSTFLRKIITFYSGWTSPSQKNVRCDWIISNCNGGWRNDTKSWGCQTTTENSSATRRLCH